jgi:hypothetical protein
VTKTDIPQNDFCRRADIYLANCIRISAIVKSRRHCF